MAGVNATPAARPNPPCEIEDLHVAVDDREILRGLSLAVGPGRAPRADGAERLREVDPGQHPARQPGLRDHRRPDPARRRGHHRRCPPTSGRPGACSSASSIPEEIPGVSVFNFLRQAMVRRKGIDDFSMLEVRMQIMAWSKRLGMDDRFQDRYLNEGFSGGEKKRNEMLQMALLEPDVAVLDETDSGLDIDALARGRGRHPGGAARPPAARHPARSPTTSASSTTSCPTSSTSWSTAGSSRPVAPSSPRRSRRVGSTPSGNRWHDHDRLRRRHA